MKDEISATEKICRLTDEAPIFISKYEFLEDEPFPFDIEHDRMYDAFFEKFKSNDFIRSYFFDVASIFLRKAAYLKNNVVVYASPEKNYGVVQADMIILGIDQKLINLLSLGKTDIMMLSTMFRNDIKGIIIHLGMPLFIDE